MNSRGAADKAPTSAAGTCPPAEAGNKEGTRQGLNNCTKDPSLDYEHELLISYSTVIALDEAGRGALAGPVAVGAQVFDAELADPPQGLRDSKLLSASRRTQIAEELANWGSGTVGFVSPQDIDAHGITRALGEAGNRAITELLATGINPQTTVVLLDGKHDWLTPCLAVPLTVITRVGADRACVSVAAASVRAKVARDSLMLKAAQQYPGYGWESNKGYGSAAHLAAISELGITEMHRKTWIKPQIQTLF